jgi:hypothetical protein
MAAPILAMAQNLAACRRLPELLQERLNEGKRHWWPRRFNGGAATECERLKRRRLEQEGPKCRTDRSLQAGPGDDALAIGGWRMWARSGAARRLEFEQPTRRQERYRPLRKMRRD